MKATVMFRGTRFAETEIEVPQKDGEAIGNDLLKRYVMAMFMGDKEGVKKMTELYSISEGTLSTMEGRPFNASAEALKEWIDGAFSVVLESETVEDPNI